MNPDIPDSLNNDPDVFVKELPGAGEYGSQASMEAEHGQRFTWEQFVQEHPDIQPTELSEILDKIVQGKTYHTQTYVIQPITENASAGAVGAGAIASSGQPLGRKTTTRGSIFTGGRPITEKKTSIERAGKKWAKAIHRGDMKKAQSITDKVRKGDDMKEAIGDHLNRAKEFVSGKINTAVDAVRDKAIDHLPGMDMNKVDPSARSVHPMVPVGLDDAMGKMAWGALGVSTTKNPDGSYTLASKTAKPMDRRLLSRMDAVAHHLNMDYKISDDERSVTISERGAGVDREMDVHEARHAKREKAAMRSPTTPNKKMQQFVGEMKKFVEAVAPVGMSSPMEKLATSLSARVIKRFGGHAGVGGSWRWSDVNYAIPIVMSPDIGGLLTLIVSAFADNTYTYRWYTGRHGLDVSELDRADQIGGQYLYGGTRGNVNVMLKDIDDNLKEFGRRYEEHERENSIEESHSVGDRLSWEKNGVLYEGRISSIYGTQAVVSLGDGGLESILGSAIKVRVDLSELAEAKQEETEGKNKNYHSVFFKNDDGRYAHHFDADNLEDANAEMRTLRNQGDKPVRLVVPKGEANWHKRDVHDYVTSRLKRPVK